MTDLIIHLPAVSDDKVSADLRYLTRVIDEDAAKAAESGGFWGLGGADGYGADFENDVFMMHPYCWCEGPDCPWCLACECGEDAVRYLDPQGNEVDSDTYYDFDAHDYRWGSVEDIPEKQCKNCKSGERDFAPNFLHKPTGTKVTWYKYIGRGMETEVNGNWVDIFADCIASLNKETP